MRSGAFVIESMEWMPDQFLRKRRCVSPAAIPDELAAVQALTIEPQP